jgi:hypothetical protein
LVHAKVVKLGEFVRRVGVVEDRAKIHMNRA